MSVTAAEEIQPQPSIPELFENVDIDTLIAEQSGYIISFRLLQMFRDIYGSFSSFCIVLTTP